MSCFSHNRRCLRVFGLCIALLSLLIVPGCSLGFTNLHPGENSALYQHMFADIIGVHDEPYWLWVRGTITGDLDGDGSVEEEVVLATIQKGSKKLPGPIEMAFLVACRVDEEGNRQAIARQLLFDRSPIPRAPRPELDVETIVDNPLTRCRAQMIQDKVTLAESVVVYFWTDPLPCSVWYVGYTMRENKFVKNLETVMWQSTPGVLVSNLDRSVEASPFGYQLVFGVAALPERATTRLGAPSEAPLWGHVYSRNSHGYYEQADGRFAENYSKLEPIWNQAYLKAIVKGAPADELAWYEYYLAILNHYLENEDMASAYIAKAKANAVEQELIDAIPQVELLLQSGKGAQSEQRQDTHPEENHPEDWHPDYQWDPNSDWVPSEQGGNSDG